MFKFLYQCLQRLEKFERHYARIFWSHVISLSVFLFYEPYEPIQRPSQSHVIIDQVRGGAQDSDKRNSLNKRIRKIKNFDPNFHRQLKQSFPDWKERMDYQKKQEEFYKSAMKAKRELKRLRMKENSNFYTKKELDAIDYFHGTGIYAKFQDPKTKPNIFDTRISYVLKMQDDKLRDEFLNSLSRRKN